MHTFFHSFVAATVLACSLAVPASAQVQTKAQQACLNKVVKTARKIPGAVLKDAAQCIKKGAVGNLPMGETADSCAVGDLKGKVSKARGKLATAASKSCNVPPDFGFSDAATASEAYVSENEVLMIDGFGTDLEAALAASDAVDPAGRCSSLLPALWRRVEDAMHRSVEACLKSGLKAKTLTSATGFEDCLDAIHDDTRGRIGKALTLFEKKLPTKCPAGDLAGVFPGLVPVCTVYGAATDAAGLADCTRDRLECRVCRIFNFAYGLDRDCNLFDDGDSGNASCPECGNTVIDIGEDCDDGNEVGGDGCNEFCRDEFCGDGIINDSGSEQCDDGGANSDSQPNACRTNCQNPTCGDGVTDAGEECDDGNDDETDGCLSSCTICGNGSVSGSEQCDDGNIAAGDCCSPSCTYEPMASACTGPPSGQCTAPGCDGAGTCTELPANEGGFCDDGDECTNNSTCQSGACTVNSYVITGLACRYSVVGNPGGANAKRLEISQQGTSTGHWCGKFARIGENTVLGGEVVLTAGDNTTPAAEIDNLVNLDTSSVYTNNARINGLAGDNLPGLVATTTIAAGNLVSKMPAGVYDTRGVDPRIADCQGAQTAISSSTAGLLDALSQTFNFGATLQGLASNSSHTINAVNPGSINVFDFTNITGGNNVTINFSGGNDSDTVMIVRVASSFDTNIGWQINLIDGLLPSRFLIYGKGTSNSDCEIGQASTGSGTIFCPNARIRLVLNSTWTGALYGGGDSLISIDIGDGADLIFERFTGL